MYSQSKWLLKYNLDKIILNNKSMQPLTKENQCLLYQISLTRIIILLSEVFGSHQR